MSLVGNNRNLSVASVGYQSCAKDIPLRDFAAQQLLVHSALAYNKSGSQMYVGMGLRLDGTNTASLQFYNQSGASIPQTAVTVAGTTANSGILIGAKLRFHVVDFIVTQAQTGSPAYTYQYWNGSAWMNLTLISTPDFTQTGEQVLAFNAPADWATGNGGVTADLSSAGQGYFLRILATTPPTQAVIASSATVSRMWALKVVPANSYMEVDFGPKPYLFDARETIQPYFQIANALNSVDIAYQLQL